MDAMQLAQMAQMQAAYAQFDQQAATANQPPPPNAYTDADWGIPGFGEALSEAVSPLSQPGVMMDSDQMYAIEDIKNKVGNKIIKASKKFTSDDRLHNSGTSLQARSLVEEFVDWCAGAVSQAFYDKPWLEKVNLAAPLLAAGLHTFNGAKIFTRTLAPMLPKYIEEALFRYAEEERVTKAMFDAVVASGVKENMQKKASQHLAKAYDKAHIGAPYGGTTCDTAELGMLQDFVKGWMTEFLSIANWDVMKYGIETSGGKPSKGDQILFLTVLFQNLTDARNAALPHELTSLIETPPPSPWAFIAETADGVFETVAQKEQEEQAKNAAQGMGMGMGGMAMPGMGGGGGGCGGGMDDMAGMMQMMQAMEGMMGGMDGMMMPMMGMGMDMGMDGGKGMDAGKGGKGGGKGGKGGKDGGKGGWEGGNSWGGGGGW